MHCLRSFLEKHWEARVVMSPTLPMRNAGSGGEPCLRSHTHWMWSQDAEATVGTTDSAFSVPLCTRKKTEGCLAFGYQEELHCCSVTKLCPAFCDPMDCSTPGSSVLHSLLEFAQTHVRWVGDVIQPSHPLSPPSSPALNLSQHQGLFQWVGSSHKVTKVLELQLQHQSF